MGSQRTDLSGLEVVFLDAGHTLLRPEPEVEQRYARTLSRFGLSVDPAEIRPRFSRLWREGRAAREVSLYRTDPAGTKRFWKEFVRAVFEPWLEGFDRFDPFFEELYEEFATRDAWLLFDDVGPALDRLDGLGYRLGVISNWDHRLRQLLDGLGLARRFEAVVISAEEGYEKPAREIFERALARLGDLPPEAAIHVGDSLEDDVAGALGAGLRAAHLDRRGGSARLGEWLTVSSLAELAERLPPAR